MIFKKVETFMLAREILLAIKDKKALSEFSHKIDELYEKDKELNPVWVNNKSIIDRLIMWTAETFSDTDDYTDILKFLEEKGLSDESFKQERQIDRWFYWLSKYYTLPDDMEDMKEKAYCEFKALLIDGFFGENNGLNNHSPFLSYFLSILPVCLTDDKRLLNEISEWWDSAQASEIYLCSCILDMKAGMLECAMNKKYKFRLHPMFELFFTLSEEYHEFIQENLISAVPVLFRKNKTTLRKKEELIPFLFRSKRTADLIGDDADSTDILNYLYTHLKKDVFNDIVEYIPEITQVHFASIPSVTAYDTDLKKVLGMKFSSRVVIYDNDDNSYDLGYRFCFPELKENFPDTSFVIGYTVLKNGKIYSGSLMDFMENLSVDDIEPDTDDLHTELVDINSSEIISHAVRLKIINQSNIEECIRYAVENRCTDALFRLNSEYKNLSE